MHPASEALLQVLREGGARAGVAWLHEKHRGNLTRYLWTLVPRLAVDDVEQEVWRAVAEGIEAYRGDARPDVWLLRIAHHKAVDVLRASRREQALGSEVLVAALTATIAPPRSPSSELQGKRRWQRTWRAVEELRADERELLLLSHVQDLGPSEIALVIGHQGPANTVAQRISRIVAGLRRRLQEEEDEPRA